MKPPARKPTIPPDAVSTPRRAIIDLLGSGTFSAREISAALGLSEKEIYGHLDHIRRSLHGGDEVLEVSPSACRSCGFSFAKRTRLTPPGRCPVCRHESIADPLFTIHRR